MCCGKHSELHGPIDVLHGADNHCDDHHAAQQYCCEAHQEAEEAEQPKDSNDCCPHELLILHPEVTNILGFQNEIVIDQGSVDLLVSYNLFLPFHSGQVVQAKNNSPPIKIPSFSCACTGNFRC